MIILLNAEKEKRNDDKQILLLIIKIIRITIIITDIFIHQTLLEAEIIRDKKADSILNQIRFKLNQTQV